MLVTGKKTDSQLEAMREGGRLLATIFAGLRHQVVVGMSEREADTWVEREIKALGAEVTYKTSEVNFPNAICISTNDDVVHGIASDYCWRKGDVVGFDLVITYKGMKTDAAFSMVVGQEPHGDVRRLLDYTERSLYAGIDAIQRKKKTGDIGAAVQLVLEQGKLGIIHDLVGHGVGLKMHMPPDIPNYGRPDTGVLLKPGDTIAIEPMATLGGSGVVVDATDGWTIKTADGSLAAHFEHTVLITESGAEILTAL